MNAHSALAQHASGECADVHSSSEEYARRFSGPVGSWFLDLQKKILLDHLDAIAPRYSVSTVLDVGGGHGQIAEPLIEAGSTVTVLGSEDVCRSRLEGLIAGGKCSFDKGSLVKLPYPDRSFDVVTCFRIVSHTDDWKTLLRNCCRVARSAVVIDYPTLRSLNVGTPLLFSLKRGIEGNTRTYTIFSEEEVNEVFRESGFVRARRTPQFFFPMGLHRGLKRPGVSRMLESVMRGTGLTSLLGSPVIGTWTRSW